MPGLVREHEQAFEVGMHATRDRTKRCVFIRGHGHSPRMLFGRVRTTNERVPVEQGTALVITGRSTPREHCAQEFTVIGDYPIADAPRVLDVLWLHATRTTVCDEAIPVATRQRARLSV